MQILGTEYSFALGLDGGCIRRLWVIIKLKMWPEQCQYVWRYTFVSSSFLIVDQPCFYHFSSSLCFQELWIDIFVLYSIIYRLVYYFFVKINIYIILLYYYINISLIKKFFNDLIWLMAYFTNKIDIFIATTKANESYLSAIFILVKSEVMYFFRLCRLHQLFCYPPVLNGLVVSAEKLNSLCKNIVPNFGANFVLQCIFLGVLFRDISISIILCLQWSFACFSVC